MPDLREFQEEEIFLPYQRDYLSLVENNEVVVAEKSRRVGLSWADAADTCLLSAASREAGGMDSFYIGYNKDMAREYIDAVAWWAGRFHSIAVEIDEEILKDEDKDITVFVIRFSSGFKAQALSSRPSNLRGKQGKVTIDEAAFHDDLPGLIKAAMALLMWGGRVSIISTHFGEDNPFNEIIQDSRSGRTGYAVLKITFREAIEQGLYQRICQVRGKRWSGDDELEWVEKMYQRYGPAAGEELDVVPTGGSEIYLPRILIERAMTGEAPVLRWALGNEFMLLPEEQRGRSIQEWCEENLLPLSSHFDRNLLHFMGEDFARSGDLTVFSVFRQESDMRLRACCIVELRNVPFEAQKQILIYLLDRIPNFTKGLFDARGNGQYLAEAAVLKYGTSIIEQVMLSRPWYAEHMPKVKAKFEDGVVYGLPKDSDIMADLRLLRNDRGVPKAPDNAHTKGTDGHNRHGDAAISIALALTAATSEYEVFEYEPVAPRSRRGHSNRFEDDDFKGVNWKKAAL